MRNHARPIALLDAAEEVASITHAHPLGIEGAVIIAMATAAATDTESPVEILQWSLGGADSEPFVSRITTALTWIKSGRVATPAEVRAELGNGIAATESCVTAVYIAARFLADSFESMISFVASCGGDVDTIGAMAGGIWGAANGEASLPHDQLEILEQKDRLFTVADELYESSNLSNSQKEGLW
jgi:poly(ADP-ribose) glycohydrolase ARH3